MQPRHPTTPKFTVTPLLPSQPGLPYFVPSCHYLSAAVSKSNNNRCSRYCFFYTNPLSILCKAFKVNQLRIKSGAFSSFFVILARGLEKQSYPHTFLSGSFIYRTSQRASRVTLIAPRENSFQEEFRLCATNLPL